ncbi:MAG: hypothetical protein A2275_06115 [Bacteroidetes bacterium RIFOXYA12_FULL_35_11]|nr:MAG: hypothetical protein A2X01_01680 [Bacteroidetes bacterium GWF2_35_48]OFY74193.1 MAG: hypothetical protein A2275_06115 [Bacteroidetes bacterium RIFOXYA12_FULL_35_11]OFY93793.1 MAG: hypothetical protein A2491_02640 [Bacteroidetes bacterium RIFOXYC12_FULL_35_7]OFY96739.1 MAG: hypothetical protein A2309_00910 [Bacteroidetes bacterium RIFOXYB2_FULL_35_7]HBX52382.1 hypothetical protein [Bacteroidales bacterium]
MNKQIISSIQYVLRCILIQVIALILSFFINKKLYGSTTKCNGMQIFLSGWSYEKKNKSFQILK